MSIFISAFRPICSSISLWCIHNITFHKNNSQMRASKFRRLKRKIFTQTICAVMQMLNIRTSNIYKRLIFKVKRKETGYSRINVVSDLDQYNCNK